MDRGVRGGGAARGVSRGGAWVTGSSAPPAAARSRASPASAPACIGPRVGRPPAEPVSPAALLGAACIIVSVVALILLRAGERDQARPLQPLSAQDAQRQKGAVDLHR